MKMDTIVVELGEHPVLLTFPDNVDMEKLEKDWHELPEDDLVSFGDYCLRWKAEWQEVHVHFVVPKTKTPF